MPNENEPVKRHARLKKSLLFIFIVAAIAAFYVFDGAQYLSIERFRSWVEQQPFIAGLSYFIIYVLICSLPVAALMTVIGGAVFGFGCGSLIVSFASSLGATFSFLLSRWLLRDWVQTKFGQYLQTINKGVEREGAFYLFSLRLIPVFPFFAINLVFGLTPIKTWTFYWVSQVGMLAGTAVYVNFGAQLANIEEFSLSGILTPGLITGLVLLGVLPLVLKKTMTLVRRKTGRGSIDDQGTK